MGDQPHASDALPTGERRYPLYRRLDVPHGHSIAIKVNNITEIITYSQIYFCFQNQIKTCVETGFK